MLIQRAYRVELKPNNKQVSLLLRHVGAGRFVYNWGLQRRIEEYNTHSPSQKNGGTILSAAGGGQFNYQPPNRASGIMRGRSTKKSAVCDDCSS